jgi:plasmid stabilization system protein ParE
MTRRVSLHELAELELNDAADFYDSKQPGLSRSFILAVQQAVLQIKEYPESANVVRGNARRKVLWQFPYNVIYSLTPDTIRILAIASQNRRPFYWRDRK